MNIIKADLENAVLRAAKHQLSLQNPEGWWWYTLEANEAIGAEYIQLLHFLDCPDEAVERGIINRILSEQNTNGSWSLYYSDKGDLNITIECYFVLKLAGHDIRSDYMTAARQYILDHGGITKSRVFTRIHLAMFGLLPWDSCPAMPPELILLPNWMPVNVYEFSSWARACIIPLLVIMNKRPVKRLKEAFNLEELYKEPQEKRNFGFTHTKGFLSWENFFVKIDRWLKLLNRVPFGSIKNQAFRACEKWIIEHIEKTEDIYPAMAYSALAMHLLGHPLSHPTIQKCLNGLKRFQQGYNGVLPAVAWVSTLDRFANARNDSMVHQQCCISPVWDTPWSISALLDAGVRPDDPRLIKAGRWLISKQITEDIGDWKIKNPHGQGGGWSFEFENVYFPDIDDTIQVIDVLMRLDIPEDEKKGPVERGLSWILSMQNDDGGWAAFDKNNRLELVNKIPFADHGACLDPSSPDITARAISLLSKFGYSKDETFVKKGLKYLFKTQTPFGAWFGRWGVNYIYGTFFVLKAFSDCRMSKDHEAVKRAVRWLKDIQRSDGGFSESPESYKEQRYIPYPESVPSQTAWAVMGLIAAGEANSAAVQNGVKYLLDNLSGDGTWEEKYYTGTGFPGHFYIRYHGYRHFFPLMAIAQYFNSTHGQTAD